MPPLPKIKDESSMKAIRLNHHRVFLTAVLAGLLALAGCQPFNPNARTDLLKIFDQEQQKAKQVSLTIQQRTFDLSQDSLVKALVNTFSNKNLTVLTLEKSSGYMMSEGPQFLDKNALINISRERNNQFNSELSMGDGWMTYFVPKVKLRVTVNLYKKEKNRTLVKLKVNHLHQNCMLCDDGICLDKPKAAETYCPVSPAMVSMWYQQLWDEVEKSIFMQRETILE
jgi:hypothetical protein